MPAMPAFACRCHLRTNIRTRLHYQDNALAVLTAAQKTTPRGQAWPPASASVVPIGQAPHRGTSSWTDPWVLIFLKEHNETVFVQVYGWGKLRPQKTANGLPHSPSHGHFLSHVSRFQLTDLRQARLWRMGSKKQSSSVPYPSQVCIWAAHALPICISSDKLLKY